MQRSILFGSLFKEQVSTKQECCPDCPKLSATGGNIIVCSEDGLYASSAEMPIRTTAQRPVTPNGLELAYNTDLDSFEFHDGSLWVTYGDDNVKLYNTTTVVFDRMNQYGTSAVPIIGDITFDLLGALKGKVQIMVHNDSVTPNFPVEAKIVGTYVTNQVNVIRFTYVDIGLVLVEIL